MDGHPMAAVPIRDDAPALAVVLLTAANARAHCPGRRVRWRDGTPTGRSA
jgi:hypothetical protein